MAAKNVILRKKIEGVIYDLLPKTGFDQVIQESDSKTLATVVTELLASIASKADNSEFQSYKTAFDGLMQDAPDTYDTLKEIGDYITSHQDEYEALLAISGNKVDKVPGKQLSTEDFTTELKTKLEELYTKAQIDGLFTTANGKIDANTAAITKLNADSSTEGSVDYKVKQASDALQTQITTNKNAIDAINNEGTGILAQAKSYTDTKVGEVDAKVTTNTAAIADINDPTDGILAQAKEYADTKVGGTAKIYAQETEPPALTENDLWIYYQDEAEG